MYVCICKQITDRDIHGALDNGACSFKDIRNELGVGTECGECTNHVRKCIRQAHKESCEPIFPQVTTAV